MLRLKVVFQGLEAGDQNAIGETLHKHVNKIIPTIISSNTHFINDILQQELLVFVGKLLRCNNIRLEDQDENGVLDGTGAINPVAARVQLSTHGLGRFPKLRYSVGVVLEKVDSLTGGGGKQGGKGSRESV